LTCQHRNTEPVFFFSLYSFSRFIHMISPSHTFSEAALEAKKDYRSRAFINKEGAIKRELDKKFRYRRDYPLFMNIIWTHPESKNKWLFSIHILNKNQHKSPRVTYGIIFERHDGRYVLAPTFQNGPEMWILYPPHFFKRYRERICGDENMSNLDVITRYFERNYVTGIDIGKGVTGYQACYGSNYPEQRDFTGKVDEGTVFGTFYKASQYKSIVVLKTIVRNDMLFEDQHEAHDWIEDEIRSFIAGLLTRK